MNLKVLFPQSPHTTLRLLLFIFFACASALALASQTDTSQAINGQSYVVHITDQNGQALQHAVVVDPSESSEANQSQAVMDQQSKAFDPFVLAVTQGAQVSFPNSDNIRHHVYSFSKPKPFEIKLYADTPESPVEFDQPGVVVLGCDIHDHMIGYIYVSPWRHFATSSPAGKAELKGLNTAPKELLVWHPWLGEAASPMKVSDPKWDQNIFAMTLEVTPPPPPKKTSRFAR